MSSVFIVLHDKTEVKYSNEITLNSEIVRFDILVDQTYAMQLLQRLQHLLTNLF